MRVSVKRNQEPEIRSRIKKKTKVTSETEIHLDNGIFLLFPFFSHLRDFFKHRKN